MISTAFAIQQATADSILDGSTVVLAKMITENHSMMTEEDFVNILFQYSAHLSALTASLVVEACLTTDQLNDMINTIDELNSIGKDEE